MSPNVIWVTWLVLFAIFEGAALWSKKAGDTLSERTREWFETTKPGGRIIFGVSWAAFALWFFLHILYQ